MPGSGTVTVQYHNFKGNHMSFSWPETGFMLTPMGILFETGQHSQAFIPWHLVDGIEATERGLIQRLMAVPQNPMPTGGVVPRAGRELSDVERERYNAMRAVQAIRGMGSAVTADAPDGLEEFDATQAWVYGYNRAIAAVREAIHQASKSGPSSAPPATWGSRAPEFAEHAPPVQCPGSPDGFHKWAEVPGSGYGGANELSICSVCGARVKD